MENSVYKTDESRATRVEVGMMPMESHWLESLPALRSLWWSLEPRGAHGKIVSVEQALLPGIWGSRHAGDSHSGALERGVQGTERGMEECHRRQNWGQHL